MTDATPGMRTQTGLGGPESNGAKPAAGGQTERRDMVMELAGALRSAARAHTAYVAELRLGDVEPAEDWSTWYAEYLLECEDG